MKIGTIGYNYRHDRDFVMERLNGTGCRLMLIIKEDSVFLINGKEYDVRKNSFVLFSPSTAYKYYGKNGIYADDWIYFDFEEGDEEKFCRMGIVSDQIVYLGNTEELSQLIQFIAYEHYSPEEEHETVERYFTEIFLIKLGRLIRNRESHSHVSADKNNRFVQLRSKIYTMPEEIGDVEELAQLMGMSRSGLQHSYKNIFGVSIMSDIIRARMERASQLLLSTTLSVRDIALKCGYTNEYGFMRRFKAYFGKTPTQFRSML